MTLDEYITLLNKAVKASEGKDERGEALAFCDLSEQIDALSYEERIRLRNEIKALNDTGRAMLGVLRNLYFDYQRQCWIGGEREIVNEFGKTLPARIESEDPEGNSTK